MPAAATAAANKHIPSSRKDDPSPRSRQSERPSDKGLDSKGIRRPDGPAVHGSSPAPDRLARVGSGAVPHTNSPSKPLPDPESQRSQHGKRKATAAPGDGDLPSSPEAGHKERRGKDKSKGKDKSQKEDKKDRHDRDREGGKQTDVARESVQVKTEAGSQDRDATRERDTTRDINKERDIPREIPRDFSREVPRDIPRDPRDTPRDLPRDVTRESPRDYTRDRDGKRSKDKDGKHHQSRSKGEADMPPAAGGGGEVTRQADREDRPAVEPQRTADNEGRRESRTSVKEEAVTGEQHRETKHGRSAPAALEADVLTRERCVF